jgi:hypothetical protein
MRVSISLRGRRSNQRHAAVSDGPRASNIEIEVLVLLLLSMACLFNDKGEAKRPKFGVSAFSTSTGTSTSRSLLGGKQEKYKVWLHFSPLVGGPPFLPLHVSVILNKENHMKYSEIVGEGPTTEDQLLRFDYLPQNARDKEVMQQLMSLQQVPGLVRYSGKSSAFSPKGSNKYTWDTMLETNAIMLGITTTDVASIHKFCKTYQEEMGSLHLVTNNCVTFSWFLLNFIDVDWQWQYSLQQPSGDA